MSRGAVVLVPFPFTDLSAVKQRPALVLRSDAAEPDLVVCAITSQLAGPVTESEFVIPAAELAGCGLPKPSKIKLAKLFTLHASSVLDPPKNRRAFPGYLGTRPGEDASLVRA